MWKLSTALHRHFSARIEISTLAQVVRLHHICVVFLERLFADSHTLPCIWIGCAHSFEHLVELSNFQWKKRSTRLAWGRHFLEKELQIKSQFLSKSACFVLWSSKRFAGSAYVGLSNSWQKSRDLCITPLCFALLVVSYSSLFLVGGSHFGVTC